MSGHSKWSTIKHQKGVADQRRGQLFSKLSRVISVAAREGSDPESNFKLRLAIEKAKQANMPKDNIERAIKKGSGEGGKDSWAEATYEGYGPAKVAVIVETITDNKNRTTAEIKNLFERGGGRLVDPGAVSYLFKKTGLVVLKKPENSEEAMLKIIDLGIEDVEEGKETIEVYTRPEEANQTAQKLKEAGYLVLEQELVMEPKATVKVVDQEKREKILKFMELLESHDDVQKTFANFDFAL